MEYLIKQYPLDTGALEIQYIEEFFGEFPRKKTAHEITKRLRDREFLILMAEAPLPDDPGMVVPVSFKVVHELREFDRNKQVRLVPNFKLLRGGHRFIFTAEGAKTRVDHELEMTPKGVFKIFIPLMGMMGKKNLRDTANALQRYLERR